MASRYLIEFIDAALFCTSPFGLSYTDPDQKLLVREHLLSLFQDFPSLISSFDTFIHNDGTTVNLLNATGDLQISPSTPAVPITIWLHENYPKLAPIVFVSSNSTYRIQNDHPFVDPSGATTSPYLQSWSHPRSNLSGLVHNLINLFSLIHPFSISSYPSVSSHPSVFSKMEAMDRLSYYLHSDMAAMKAAIEEELEGLSSLQSEMIKRVDMASSLVMALEHEESSLKRRVMQLREQADVLTNWLRVNDHHHHHHHQVNVLGDDDEMEDPFEVVDEKSKLVLDCFAADCALEDVFYELDKAVEQGAVSFEMYIKQVRALAREQFFHRVKAENLRGEMKFISI
ncbi:protein ELC-like [Diospyros lotus]|uniref:protein ELC-like n=1 Tax=Diospyros lotus TaxID=55363 RepID=UPI00224F44F8|nr:protein ELC-like [Diospyros lotus]